MGKSRVHWLCFPLLKLISNFRRCPLSKRSLIIATVCVVYLFFVVSQVGYSQPHRGRRIDKDNSRHIRGLYNLESNGAVPDSADLQTGFVVPTRSNVVYITLKSKRLKPAHIRGTIRPKLRRKVRRNKTSNPYFTQNKLGTLERDAGQIKQNFALQTSWKETRDVDFISVDILFQQSNKDADADSQISAIRIYSQKAPPWFSEQDVKTMRFLADAKVLRMREVSHGDSPSLLIFEGETSVLPVSQKHTHRRNHACGGQCGVVQSPVDNTEVFAFHLDRLLGLNRTLPTVSRKFSFLHDGQSCPVVSWDASLYPESLAGGWPTVRLTWGEYQSSLKQRCWHKNIIPKPDSGCSTIHHYEWSKLALFDFLLQIHNRLDRSCCGFRPRREYVCVELGLHSECGNQDHVQLANVIHRGHDPRHLVFTNNEGFFDRNEDNLDFRLLEGIKELPEQAVSVLRSRKLREKLLQSLFLDQTYWESQGGRQGIDKLIDVIERRAEVLLTYITAHGIKVITMNV
ncbi:Golgi-associated kinase 1B [Brachyistius frenatus]|uniref:Golgi-associated kinase 1B n=1 Tax=Brachyistius frenatus TaxID=100188 RepID=UPI0037E9A498